MFSFILLVFFIGIFIGYQSDKDMDDGIYRVVYERILTEDGVPCQTLGRYFSANNSFVVLVEDRSWADVMETCSHEYLHHKWGKGHFG